VIGRGLLTALAVVFFVIGWIAGKIALALSWTAKKVAHSWMGAAIKVGWIDAQKRRSRSG